MLEEPADELGSGQSHGIPTGVPGILVAEGDVSVVNGHDAVIGDGNAVDVASEISQYCVGSLDSGFAVDDPLFIPDFLWEWLVSEGSACQVHERGTEERRERVNRDQIVLSGREPG
jgi:hypothetical protein